MQGIVQLVRLGGVRGLSAPLSLACAGVNRGGARDGRWDGVGVEQGIESRG